jgi:hypothetical protein
LELLSMSHDPNRSDLEKLRDDVRARITMVEVCAKCGIEGRREGHAFRARCPFHEEKSGSFLIGGRAPDRAYCFGCGWSGDIFAFYEQREGVTHVEAVNRLASLLGLASVIQGVAWEKPKAKVLTPLTGARRFEKGEKPSLPKLRAAREGEMQALAELRGLSFAGVRTAAEVMRRVGFCEWPLYLNKWQNRWASPCETHWWKCKQDQAECKPVPRFTAWVVTDDSRWVAQFRRMDGEMYVPRAAAEEGKERKPFKSWTEGTATWPIGAADLAGRSNVLLVEGGADMLACYHFLHHFGRLRDVAVVCMLGAHGRIADAALPHFKGKRVRIICDADEEKVKITKRKDGTETVSKSRPGLDAAERWKEQLTAAGAAVKTFFLGDVLDADGGLIVPGLVRADGTPVKDTNDLVYCAAEVRESDEVRDAFCEWKEGFGG